jgi:hypothetical protein
MPLVPKRELDREIKNREKLETEQEKLETELEQQAVELVQAREKIEELEGFVSLGRRKPVDQELALLLQLEEEIRKTEHPMTDHQYSPDELQWILDQLVLVRVVDPPKEKTDPESQPPEKKTDPPAEKPDGERVIDKGPVLLKLCK